MDALLECFPETPLLVFVSVNSGNGLTVYFLDHFPDDPSVHLVRLPSEASIWIITYEFILTDPSLRCISCGGDGTANWVHTMLTTHFSLTEERRRPTWWLLALKTQHFSLITWLTNVILQDPKRVTWVSNFISAATLSTILLPNCRYW